MPNATRPHKTNKTAGGFTLKIGGNLIGDVIEGNIVVGKENIDIMNALVSRPKERLEFLLPPVITCTCVDIQWDTISEIAGIAESTESAGTDNYATDIGFTIYDDTMVHINNDSSKTGSDSIVLNSVADGGGTTYTEDDDYVVDDTRGMVQCIPTGTHTLADETTVYVGSGTYTTGDSKRILLQHDAIDTEDNITLEHTFSDGETLSVYLYKANVTGDLGVNFPFNRTELVNLPITITGLYDSTHDAEEYGYIDISTS
jgi:hypothetical protein